MLTLKDEWYVVIQAYRFTIFEILRDFFGCCISVLALHIESADSDTSLHKRRMCKLIGKNGKTNSVVNWQTHNPVTCTPLPGQGNALVVETCW